MIYIFHRETGTPFFPIEERPVPQDGVLGEVLSPTQPFPTAPPPLVPHGSSLDEFWSPLKAKCEEKYSSARFGPIFTPPSLEGTVVTPSTAGGVNWGSVAIDKGSNILVTNVNRAQHFVQLIPNEQITSEPDESGEFKVGEPRPLHGTPYHLKQGPVMSPYYAPCTEPPWAQLVAVDIEKGEILWKSALGTLDKLAPLPIPLKWGTPTFGGPMITAGGLVFIGATADDRIRAFDISNGEEVWEYELPTGAFTMPMSYEIDGRQYIVVAAGGHPFIYRRPGDYITAFALGEQQSVWQRFMGLFN
jgi:quinoprotein glucose dehydrogenase